MLICLLRPNLYPGNSPIYVSSSVGFDRRLLVPAPSVISGSSAQGHPGRPGVVRLRLFWTLDLGVLGLTCWLSECKFLAAGLRSSRGSVCSQGPQAHSPLLEGQQENHARCDVIAGVAFVRSESQVAQGVGFCERARLG